MNTSHDIESRIQSATPTLSPDAKALLWDRIRSQINGPVPSPYRFSFVSIRPFVPLLITVLVITGLGGTVVSADTARPGDTLFSIDRTIEDLRIALATDEGRAFLAEQFAQERLTELRAILDEEVLIDTTEPISEQNSRTSKMFADDNPSLGDSLEVDLSATSLDDTISANRFEERAGRSLRPGSDIRVGMAVEIARRFIEDSPMDPAVRDSLLAELLDEVSDIDVPRESRDDDRGDRIEYEYNGTKFRVRSDDGRVRIDVRDEKPSEDNDHVGNGMIPMPPVSEDGSVSEDMRYGDWDNSDSDEEDTDDDRDDEHEDESDDDYDDSDDAEHHEAEDEDEEEEGDDD